jgi:hypothetical protein
VEGTFPSEKMFSSQKGPTIKFFKTPHHFYFSSFFPMMRENWAEGGGKKKKILPLRSTIKAVLLIWGNARLIGHYPTYFKNAAHLGHY